MTLSDIRYAIHSLLLHRLRSLLSMLGIIIGVIALITMLSIGEGAERETQKQIAQLGTNSMIIKEIALPNRESGERVRPFKPLSFDDCEKLKKNLPMLQRISPLCILKATATGRWKEVTPEILGVTPQFFEGKGLQLKEGRFLSDKDLSERKAVCVIGEEVAKSIGKAGHLRGEVRLNGLPFEVVGVLQGLNWQESPLREIAHRDLSKAIFVPLTPYTFRELSEILIHVNNRDSLKDAELLTRQILKRPTGEAENYQIIIPNELLLQAKRAQQTFKLVLGGISALSLLVGGIGIMNAMLATVFERKKEIGIRRALGASKRHILIQFILEATVLCLAGALVGIACGASLSLFIGYLFGWATFVTAWSLCLAIGMAFFAGLSFSLYPAYIAASLDPIVILR